MSSVLVKPTIPKNLEAWIYKLKDNVGMKYGVLPHYKRIPGYTYVLSFGVGLNTFALLLEIVKRGLPLDYVVTAYVGFESKATDAYLEKYMIPYMIKKNIPYGMVCKRRADKTQWDIDDYFIEKSRVPDRITRECTRMFKVEPIHKFYTKQLKTKNIIEYIGFGKNEDGRIKPSKTEWITRCCPLYEWHIDRADCVKIVSENGFSKIPPKSSCINCFANNKSYYYNLWRNDREGWNRCIKIEQNYLDRKKRLEMKEWYYWTDKGKPTPLKDLEKQFKKTSNLLDFEFGGQSNIFGDTGFKKDEVDDCEDYCFVD